MAKMLCIAGRQHPCHTGLVAGQVYEVTISPFCCSFRAAAEGSVFIRPITVHCRICGKFHRNCKLVPWGPWRFIPWSEEIEKEIRSEIEDQPLETI